MSHIMYGIALVAKLSGLGLLFASFATLGRSAAYKVEDRPRELGLAIAGLELLASEVGYGLIRMEPALTKVANSLRARRNSPDSKVIEIFQSSGDSLRLGLGETAGTAWATAIDRVRERTSLSPQDLEILSSLSDTLGASGMTQQVRNLQLATASLRNQLSQAQDDALRLGKVYRSTWTALGACIVLLLI